MDAADITLGQGCDNTMGAGKLAVHQTSGMPYSYCFAYTTKPQDTAVLGGIIFVDHIEVELSIRCGSMLPGFSCGFAEPYHARKLELLGLAPFQEAVCRGLQPMGSQPN